MGIVHSHEDESKKNVIYATSKFPIMPLTCPEKNLHNLCFSFLLGMTAVPRKKCLCKILGGKYGALWDMWKWRIAPNAMFYSSSAISTSPITRLVCPQYFSITVALSLPCVLVVPREIKDCLSKTRSIMEGVKMANSPF